MRSDPAARHPRGPDGRLDGRRGAAADPHRGSGHLLQPIAPVVLAQGRHLGSRAVRGVGRSRLRWRCPARPGRPGGCRVPHRHQDLLRGRRPAAGGRGHRGDRAASMTTTPTDPAVPVSVDWGQTWPTLPEFRSLAVERRVIPVARRLLADVTPVGLYRTLSLIHISEPTRLGMISYAVF